MIHLKIIHRILGVLLLIESGILLLCALLPIFYGEDDLFGFIMASLISVCCGMTFMRIGKSARKREGSMTRRDGYIVVAISWVLFSIFGSMPFYISGYIPSFTDAFFETMSGFTTTGATIIQDVEVIPHGLLFWRSLTQWIGGLGIVFFTVAVLPIFGVGEVQLFAAEAIGPTRNKLHPRISISGRWIITVYMLITVLCAVALRLCGMRIFDGVNHALTTAATGGFSTKNASIAYFNSHAIEYVITFFMFLSGINYGLIFFLVFRGQIRKLIEDTQFKWYVMLLLLFTAIVGIGLFVSTPYNGAASFRLCRIHHWWYENHSYSHPVQVHAQRVQPHTAPQRSTAGPNQRKGHTSVNPPERAHVQHILLCAGICRLVLLPGNRNRHSRGIRHIAFMPEQYRSYNR